MCLKKRRKGRKRKKETEAVEKIQQGQQFPQKMSLRLGIQRLEFLTGLPLTSHVTLGNTLNFSVSVFLNL